MHCFVPGSLRARRATWSAAVLLALAVTASPLPAGAAGVSPAQASAEQKKLAQEQYVEGAKLYEAGRFDEALAAFRASYDVVASPNSHLMIARVLGKKGDLVAAYNELLQVEIEADALEKDDPKYADAVLRASGDRAALRSKVGLLTVRVTGGDATAKILVAGTDVPSDRWGKPVAVPPGAVRITATRGDQELTRDVRVAAGASAVVDIAVPAAKAPAVAAAPAPLAPLAPLAEPAPPHRRTSLKPYAAAAGVVGVAGLAVFAIEGAMNRSTFSGLRNTCVGGHCTTDQQADIDRGRTQQTVANVGLVIGLVGLGAGAALILLDPKPDRSAASLRVGPGSMSFERSF